MPFSCGLPCFGTKDKRHPEEKIVEKPVYIAVPVQTSTTAPTPAAKAEQPLSAASPTSDKTRQSSYQSASEQAPAASVQELPATSPETVPKEDTEMADSLKGAASGLGNTVSSGAQQASSGVQNAASTAQGTASSGAEKVSSGAQSAAGTVTGQGTQDWEAMNEEQKKATFDALPSDQKKGLSYYEWVMQGYQHSKENWMPWIEDVYLKWFTKDNKVSYATKDTLDKSKVTGIEQVDTLQDGVNNVAAQQVGQGGLLQPIGDIASKEGVNRAERGGKDDSGSYTGSQSYAGAIGSSVSSAGGSVLSGAKSAGGYVGGLFGGKKDETTESK